MIFAKGFGQVICAKPPKFTQKLSRTVRTVAMGVQLSSAPHLTRLMSRADQARYGVGSDTRDTPKSSRKRDRDERREQGDFANWLLLQNSQGRKIPFCWHALHKPSKATPGTPDFWVGVTGHGIWLEFKWDGCKLSPEQEEFRLACEAQRVEFYIVYNARQAIALVQAFSTCGGVGFRSAHD
jgi:hypothetical protein